MTPPAVASISEVTEGDAVASWACGITLQTNIWYSWRARAFDGQLYSEWMEGAAFLVNPENSAPSIPIINSPPDQTEVNSLQPNLVIINSVDPDNDSLDYEFEVYADEAMTALVACDLVSETPDTTSWTLTQGLDDNTWHYWRARATDSEAFSNWASGRFFVNTANDAPVSITIFNPQDATEVDSLTPILEVTNSSDVDEDVLSYNFEVFADSAMSTLVSNGANIAVGTGASTSWTVAVNLSDNTWYYWRTQAEDGHGATSGWTGVSSFFVNNNGLDDPPEITIVEPSSDITTGPAGILISWQDHDPDSNADIALYYDIDDSGLDGTLIVSGLKEDPDGAGDSYLWDLTEMSEGTYYVYAAIADAISSRTSYGQGSITITSLDTYYLDNDEDGYGDPNISIQDYTAPQGYVLNPIDCEDSDPNVNPRKIEAITIKNQSLENFEYGRNILKVLNPSCYPYTSFELLSDFKVLDNTLNLHYRDPNSGAYDSTYWFFGRVSGEKIEFSEDAVNEEAGELYIIDRKQ